MAMKYPCPCCGYLVFSGPPGTDDICSICRWQDDVPSLREVTISIGPNKVSLIEGQRNFAAFGASAPRFRERVRAPSSMDQRDPDWRPIDLHIDAFVSNETGYTPSPKDKAKLYYWRTDYWLR